MAMHPARQAYVEEDQEVSSSSSASAMCSRYSQRVSERVLPAHAAVMGAKETEWLTDGCSYRTQMRVSTSTTSVSTIRLFSGRLEALQLTPILAATDTNYSIPSGQAGVPSQQASAVLGQFAKKRKAAAIAIPTDDRRVREALRAKSEPQTLFGERPEDRRDRLRELTYAEQEAADDDGDLAMRDGTEEAEDGEQEVEFYTEGTNELLQARRDMARYSIPRTQRRLQHQKIESQIQVSTHVKHRKAIKERLSGFELFGSQIVSERPMSMARFSPNGKMIATGDFAGSIKLLDVPNLETQKVLRGHQGMVGGLSWHPGATLVGSDVSSSSLNLASSGLDGDLHLWSLEQETPIASLQGHTARVCRTEFHPSGKYLASASYDTTWRLWDVATTTELLLQEGHSREVYTVSFNTDGSLVASGGLDSYGHIWDLRTGRAVMLLDGHVQPVYALDWSPDGYRVLSGSADSSVKCWDLRAVREQATIPGNKGGVTDLRWFKGRDDPISGMMPEASAMDEDIMPKKSGTFVVSCGFDRNVKIISTDDWALCKDLSGHDGVVYAADVTSDAQWICSASKDRTVKLWARDDLMGITDLP